MTVKDKLIELLESISAAQRLYPEMFVDMLIENGVTIVVKCKDCKHRYNKEYCPMCFEEAIEWDDDGYMETDYVMHDRTQDDGYCECGEK